MATPRCPSPTCSTRPTSRSSPSSSSPAVAPEYAMPAILALEGIAMQFDGVPALAGVELELPAGRIVALLGEAGRTEPAPASRTPRRQVARRQDHSGGLPSGGRTDRAGPAVGRASQGP